MEIEIVTFLCTLTGYKLAFNYLKGKRYVDAITICHKVEFVFNTLCHSKFVLHNGPFLRFLKQCNIIRKRHLKQTGYVKDT